MTHYNGFRHASLLLLAALFFVGTGLAGDNTIDTRVWSIHYWQSLAERGLVEVAPDVSVPPPVYNGMSGGDGPDILVTGTATNVTQSENSIFVHPLDNTKLLNSNNSTNWPFSILYGTSRYESFDGGMTWPAPPSSPTGPVGSNYGDPAAAIGRNGYYYLGYITTSFGQGVARSLNEGTSWTGATLGTGGTLDKNHLWIDNYATSPYEGNLYSTWTTFSSPYGAIEVMRSIDDAATWVSRQAVSTAIAAGSHNQGTHIQTGPGGEVYVAWSVYDQWASGLYDEDDIGFAKSVNGGVSFTPATRITNGIGGTGNIKGIRGAGVNLGGAWPVRTASFPVMAVDISGGTRNGWIYLVWTNTGVPGVNTGSGWDVYLMRSTDGGTTWSLPTRVNQDAAGLRRHYYPWISCDPSNGNLSVVYYDNRDAPSTTSTTVEVWSSNSSDGGFTWTDSQISDVSFVPAPIPGLASGYMGDYIGVDSDGGMVYPLWSDNRATPVRAYISPYAFDGGGGGGIPCGDIASFQARCIAGGTIRARLTMTDATHAGEMVEFTIDGTAYPATIMTGGTGVTRAQIAIGGFGAGSHTVELTDPDGCFSDIMVTCPTAGKADAEWEEDAEASLPAATTLIGNHPNPFNPTTSISYALSADNWVTLKIYNTLGEEIATLVNEFQTAGTRSALWNGTNDNGSPVASGIYIYRLTAGDVVKSEKMMFMK